LREDENGPRSLRIRNVRERALALARARASARVLKCVRER